MTARSHSLAAMSTERRGGGAGRPPRVPTRRWADLARLLPLLRVRSCLAFSASCSPRPTTATSPAPPPEFRRPHHPLHHRPRSPTPPSRIRRGPPPPPTALDAFWSRSGNAQADTTGIDTKRATNGIWRRLSRSRSQGSGGGGDAPNADGGEGFGRRSKKGRPTGALSVETRKRGSSERYFYSASMVANECPSFPEEECVIDYDDGGGGGSGGGASQGGDGGQQGWVKNPGRLVEGALFDFVNAHAIHTLNLRVSSESLNGTSALLPLMLRGDVGEITASFDRLAFPSLKISGGGRIRAVGLTINPCSFVPVVWRFVRRFREPFELHAAGCVFTQEDVRNSALLRDGLGRLLDRILKRVVAASNDVLEVAVAGVENFVKVNVTEVDILDNSDKISCSGTIATKVGAPDVPFEVRTGLSASHLGHVLNFPGMEMILNPGSPLQVVVPLHVLHPVDLDIGTNARVDGVTVDGRRKRVEVSATAVVTPVGPDGVPRVLYQRKYGAAWAKYSYDVAEWLTNVGRFTK